MLTLNRTSFGFLTLGIYSTILSQGYAQSEGELAQNRPDAAQLRAIEEVVVTAERRSQSIQDIPISIQAFSGDSLDKIGIGSNLELQQQVPGLVMSSNQGFGQIFIRGIGSDTLNAGVEGAVAVYVDGVYQSRPISSLLNFANIERVEVLKGPQGTLYGRNATGGAINIISKAPSRVFEGQADVQVGSYDQKVFRGSVSGPLAEGLVYGRLNVVVNNDDGYMKNTLLNVRQNKSDMLSVRGTIEFTPSERLDILLNANYDEDNQRTIFKSLNPSIGPAYTAFGAVWISDPYTVMQDVAADTPIKQYGVNTTVKYDFDAARLTSVTAFKRDVYNIINKDIDATEISWAMFQPGVGMSEKTNLYSQDFTLASTGAGPWQWTSLVSYMHQDVEFQQGSFLPLLNLLIGSTSELTTDAFGIGGQISYSFENGLKLTAGARYSAEKKKIDAVFTRNGAPTAVQDDSETWTAFTPKFVAEYSANENIMYYLSIAKGFKSGGFNGSTYSANPWDPEKATNFEMGIKSDWLDGRLRINAAAFYIDYKDLQLLVTTTSGGGLSQVMSNAAKATSKGFELNIIAKPTQQLQLSSGLQILDAEFDKYETLDTLNPGLGVVDRKGNPLTRSPDFTLNFGAEYTWPSVFEDTDITLRADGYHRSRMYFTPFKNKENASEKLPFIGNISLSFEPNGGAGFYGALFIKNITDRVYHTLMNPSTVAGNVTIVAPPRTVGVQIGFRY